MSPTSQIDSDSWIYLGLGANLPGPWGSPVETLTRALDRLAEGGVTIQAHSRFWRSRPEPPSDQPWYINAVARVATDLEPAALLAVLHRIEGAGGRQRRVVNAARTLDLDLLAYGRLMSPNGADLSLPHPRIPERAFVLLPWREIDVGWVHPRTGLSLDVMIAALPADQHAIPLDR